MTTFDHKDFKVNIARIIESKQFNEAEKGSAIWEEINHIFGFADLMELQIKLLLKSYFDKEQQQASHEN
jgi:hypothetical protein